MALATTPMPQPEPPPGTRAGVTSLRIIAAALVIGFCYWAASVVMTVLLSVLLAYFLDPLVEWLERFRMPRVVGSLVALLLLTGLLIGLGWMIWARAADFASDWPKYQQPIKEFAGEIERRIQRIEKGVTDISQREQPVGPSLPTPSGRSVREVLLAGLGSLYNILLAATFVPFLVFFMLAAKRDVWHATMQLFPPTERTRVKLTLEEITVMLRSYIAGNALVAVILMVLSMLFFWIIGLDYALLAGLVSGGLNLVPYIGFVLAVLPAMIIGLSKYTSIGPFLAIAGVLGFFHLIAVNVLVPALVGKKVHLNALAVTIALLFWGWLWGAIGFILAIPITATVKVICDRVDRWQPVGRWLGA
jgi:predicted PurR-regulated permease PerM